MHKSITGSRMIIPSLRGTLKLVKTFVGESQLKEGKGLNFVPIRTIYPHSSSNVIAGPPRVKITPIENGLVGLFISLSVLTGPAYIMSHLDNYRTLPGSTKASDDDE